MTEFNLVVDGPAVFVIQALQNTIRVDVLEFVFDAVAFFLVLSLYEKYFMFSRTRLPLRLALFALSEICRLFILR